MLSAPEYLEVRGSAIAYRKRDGDGPGLVWLGGYRSDMLGTKVQMLDEWAERHGQAFLRHDYSGHGESGGDFAEGTVSRWLEESLAILNRSASQRHILIGSSMGAWIALRMVQELAKTGDDYPVAGLILIAPAPDFTMELMEPNLTLKQKLALESDGRIEEISEYSDRPNIYTKALFEDGRANRVLEGIIHTHCPVHILQGLEDPDVPYGHALRLMEHLPADNAILTLVAGGDHRLSRPDDLALLRQAVAAMIKRED